VRARIFATALAALLITACSQPPTTTPVEPTPPDTSLGVYGKVSDAATGRPLKGVCVTLGVPGSRCWGTTDADGNYAVDMVDPWAASPGRFEVYFRLEGYQTENAPGRFIAGVLRIDFAMRREER
jgi:carboxypeptidase family protein